MMAQFTKRASELTLETHMTPVARTIVRCQTTAATLEGRRGERIH